MDSLIRFFKSDEATFMLLFGGFISLGWVHPSEMTKVRGIFIGIWRFEYQSSLGYVKHKEKVEMYHA
tara:strand:+ start:3060 stop:3260 length:201 start_codon:yes stop_codon:yes gene_type:complete